MHVLFTCSKCGARKTAPTAERLVKSGWVIVQPNHCGTCRCEVKLCPKCSKPVEVKR